MKTKAVKPIEIQRWKEILHTQRSFSPLLLRRRMSVRPRSWQGLRRDFQGRGTNRNIQCRGKTRFVLSASDGPLLRDRCQPEPAQGAQPLHGAGAHGGVRVGRGCPASSGGAPRVRSAEGGTMLWSLSPPQHPHVRRAPKEPRTGARLSSASRGCSGGAAAP